MPGDFLDLSDRDQIGMALRQLVVKGVLIRFGQGLYAKARRSTVTGKLIPVKPLPALAQEALTEKLNVQVVPSSELEKYNRGFSTQVPTGRVFAVRGRVSRKMAFDGKSIKYQYCT